MNLIFLIRNKSKEAEVQKHIIRLVNMDLNIILKSKWSCKKKDNYKNSNRAEEI